jgi:hypothetical protein
MEVADPLEMIQCLHLQTGMLQLEDHLGNADHGLGDGTQVPPSLAQSSFETR